MANYSPSTNFTEKDGFPINDPRKIIKGSEFGAEFAAISTMSSEKSDLASPVFTGTVTIPTATVATATIATANIAAGAINATSLDLLDNQKIKLGSADQLEIYYDSSNSVIADVGVGNLELRGSNVVLQNPLGTETLASFTEDGGAVLYYDNSPKIATDTNGVSIAGNVDMPDAAKILLGDDDDLQIYHSGSNSYIEDTGTGGLFIAGAATLTLMQATQGQNADKYIECTANEAVDLYYANSKKLSTTNTGIDVTGLVVDKAANGILSEFKIGGTVVGGVRGDTAVDVDDLTIGSGNISLRYANANDPATGYLSGNISPAKISTGGANGGAIDLGRAGSNFDNIYADNGTINTSDATEKQSIEELTEVETRVAVACKGLIRKFKWNSAVEQKGNEARYHFGVIAQDLQAAFAVEGLDAGDYGLFISSTWTDDNGVEQTRLGVRYTELLAFIIGGLV